MEHSTIPDVRGLDMLYLSTIGASDYYEACLIVRRENGKQAIVGRASDWPVIEARAQLAELTWLLTAQERGRAEQDMLTVEQACRLAATEDELANATTHIGVLTAHIAALEAALAEATAEQTAADIQAHPTVFVVEQPAEHITQLVDRLARDRQNDGRVPCDHPGCLDWVKPRGLLTHKRQAHGISTTGMVKSPSAAPDADSLPPQRKKCPYCNERPKAVGLDAHIKRRHPEQVTIALPGGRAGVAAPAPITPIALALGEAPWACAQCRESTHARSLKAPTLCIRCVAAQADVLLTNGHLAAA